MNTIAVITLKSIMKKIIYLLCLVLLLATCKKKDNNPPSSPTPTYSGTYAAIDVSRYSVLWGGDSIYTDTILPTSYWAKNGSKKYLPLLAIITDTTGNQIPGYEPYRDSILAVTGDVITLCINLKHGLIDTNIANGGGVWVGLYQYPGGAWNAPIGSEEWYLYGAYPYYPASSSNPSPYQHKQFVCLLDTLTQTISYTVK